MVMGAVVDAAIGWLVQSILENLFSEKLVAWTRGVGLEDDVAKLKSDVRYVQMIVDAAKGRKIENRPLAQSLGDLKELLYDAEDVMDELDYYRLQEQVTSGNPNAGDGTATASHCTATSSTLSCTLSSILGKRKRAYDTGEISPRVKHIADALRALGCDVSDALKIDGSNSAGTSSTPQSTRLTSSYLDEKVYGRGAEMESILKLMTSNRSSGIIVLPIVGMGGVGKTTLAQLVYNDQMVRSLFEIKIWVCVSDSFDVLRLTREMLDCVSKQRLPETCNLNMLQEYLEKHMESRRFIIILDDVWDDMNEHSWNKLLAPFKRTQAMGNMILVTTRKVSVAKMTGTIEPVKLGALEHDDFWLLFKSCAFGDEKYEEHPSLSTIGKRIAQELKGNPLAAKTVGALLKKNISIDNWTNILNNEEWKSIQGSGSIMPALKLSYNYLPGHLQQCFRYYCLFPKDYGIDGEELVRMWISQGFVNGNHTIKKLEDIGKAYLADLVNSGFLQQVRRGHKYLNRFVMHDLMHDLAWDVSKADFVTIDGTKCKEILPTTRHLSIVTGSAYFRIDQHENAFPGENLKKKLQVTSVRKLRSLVLIGGYDPSFFTFFLNMFKEAENLRLLQISATCDNFDCFVSNLVSCTHLRNIKLQCRDMVGELPQSLINFFHLQVLNVDTRTHLTLPTGMNNLANLQHLVVREDVHSTIASIGKMTALQELSKFKVQNASGFDIRQLQSMSQLVQLGIYQLENVRSKQEASEARLIDKVHLEDFRLSWDASSTSSGASTEISRDVLEELKPHGNLKHLQVIGYSGSISPSWLATDLSITSLQSLRLEKCKGWGVLPALEKMPALRKLGLICMPDIVEVAIPCLEELVLIELPRLEKCIATSRRELTSYPQDLIIKECPELKDFSPFTFQNFCLFEVNQDSGMSRLDNNSAELSSAEAEQKKWLSGLRQLTIHGCPHLMLLHPLPLAANTQVSIEGLSTHPIIKRSSGDLLVMSSNDLRVLDAKILAFQNLTDVTSLCIKDCPNLMSVSFEGMRQLIDLRKLTITGCGNLDWSCIIPNAASEDWKDTTCPVFPSLRHLQIESCGGIAGKWLTEMLTHMQCLEELYIEDCPQIKSLSIHHHEEESESSSLASSSECQAVMPTSLAQDEFHMHIPLNILSTVEKLCIRKCPEIKLCDSNVGFGGFTSLMELIISDCPMLFSSVDERLSLPPYAPDIRIEFPPKKLESSFPENRISLKKLVVTKSPDLQSLQLHSCMTLEDLLIYGCGQLAVLEGLQYLSSLQRLEIWQTPEPNDARVRKCQQVEEGSCHTHLLPPSLEELSILFSQDETVPYSLAHLPFLSKLAVQNCPNLTSLQLGFLTALEDLSLSACHCLASLEGLQSLGNLICLRIFGCHSLPPLLELLSQLPDGFNTFPRLETLSFDNLSALAMSFCKHITSLRHRNIFYSNGVCFTDEQEKALHLLTSLEELEFFDCANLVDLPAVLRSLHSLKRLLVGDCPCISRLPEKGLPSSLEELKINYCGVELKEQCRMLATEKLKVIIDWERVN